MAEALGAQVTLVTGIPDGYDRQTLAGLRVIAVPAPSCPRYENRYSRSGAREQHLCNDGVSLDDVDWRRFAPADVMIVAPAFREFSRLPKFGATVHAVALQGVLRQRLPDNRIRPRRDAITAAKRLVRAGHFAFLSDQDTAQPQRLAVSLARAGTVTVVTHAELGASLHHGEEIQTFAACPAAMVEPTGAGDCFATAFAVRYRESGSLEEAMRFALVAGALAVEGKGIAGIPNRAAIEERIEQVAA